MSWRWSRASIVVALLCLFVPVSAAARSGREGEDSAARIRARYATPARTWIMGIMDSIRRELVAVWQAEGVSLDPNGEPKPNGGSGGGTTTAAGQGDEGVSLDPNG